MKPVSNTVYQKKYSTIVLLLNLQDHIYQQVKTGKAGFGDIGTSMLLEVRTKTNILYLIKCKFKEFSYDKKNKCFNKFPIAYFPASWLRHRYELCSADTNKYSNILKGIRISVKGSDTGYLAQVSVTRHLRHGQGYQMSGVAGTRHLAPNSRHLLPAVWYQVPDTNIRQGI